jgi:hypothetical protein
MNKKATNENLARGLPPFCFQKFPKIWSPECSPLFSSTHDHLPYSFFLVHNNLNLPFQTDFLKPQEATGSLKLQKSFTILLRRDQERNAMPI